MDERLVAIHLHGPLADRFGARHDYSIRTPVEAVAALDANHAGFLAAFAQHDLYCIMADGDWRGGDQAAHLPVAREIHFCPVIEGRAFLGALLVGALIPSIAGTAAATIIGGVLFAGLMIGLSFLFAPKAPEKEDTKRDDNYAFSGPENVTEQGVAVPLVYGRCFTGSVVVSAGLEVAQIAAASTTPGAGFMRSMSRALPPPSSEVVPGTPVPPDGFPALVQDDDGNWYPEGWVPVLLLDVDATDEDQDPDQGAPKTATVYGIEDQDGDQRNAWNHVKGYYWYTSSAWVEDDEWLAFDA
jgi:predicted phage tail protein